jgi:hypothetical protein
MLDEVKMYQQATFPTNDIMRIAFSMSYAGGAYTTAERHQEIPAIFLDRKYDTLVLGDKYSDAYFDKSDLGDRNWYRSTTLHFISGMRDRMGKCGTRNFGLRTRKAAAWMRPVSVFSWRKRRI